MPATHAVVVTAQDAEVSCDVERVGRVIADDIANRQIPIRGRCRVGRRAALYVQVGEDARARGRAVLAGLEEAARRDGNTRTLSKFYCHGKCHI